MRQGMLSAILFLAAFANARLLAAPDQPEPRPPADATWHRLVKNHRDQLSVRRADLCLFGDSLTEFWQNQGRAAWQKQFGKWRTVNCGIAADRTEHILYRVGQMNLAVARPRVVILLAGTNNLASETPDSPDAVARGCEAILTRVRTASSDTKLVLLSIPPSGREPHSALRRSIQSTNAILASFARKAEIEFIDTYPLFVDEHDRWINDATLDGTHLSESAYATLASALQPVIEKLISASE